MYDDLGKFVTALGIPGVSAKTLKKREREYRNHWQILQQRLIIKQFRRRLRKLGTMEGQ
jgi:NAD-dependent DNA ligase